MKKILTIIITLWCCMQLHAQADSLAVVSAQPTSNLSVVPTNWHRPYYWGLHQGLNVQLSASVIAAFGKHAPHGAGFAQNLQATYLTPINNKLTLMVGGYVNNLNWSGLNARNAGLYGELSYQFNEHWEAHAYGQKNLSGNTSGFLPGLYGSYGYGLGPMGMGSPIYGGYMGGIDRIGAGVRYMPNQSFSVEVNVEQVWLPNQPYVPNMANVHDQTSSFGQRHAMPTQK
ncbi:MAG: hypothetical protein IJV36_02310 [Prevotella sp.]|nr:hypothetical protein [Prevotella sp.]